MSQRQNASAADPGMLKSLDTYWFGHGSPTTLGVFRIFIGVLAFANFFMLLLHWSAWFSEAGFIPAWIGQLWLRPGLAIWPGLPYEIPRIDLINGVTDPRITFPFFMIAMGASVTTALGLWTRASTIVLALGVVSLHHRNAAILHGGDTVLRVCVLYLVLAPCGLACSLDRLRGLWNGTIAPVPIRVSLWSQRLICYNVALLYFTTVWLKMDGNYWREGLATWFPARLAEFFRFPVPAFVNDLPFVKISTYGTLLVEFSLATLVFFRPLRKYVLLSGILMHAYIEYSMNIPLFSYLMAATYICFYDGEEIAAWAERTGHRLGKWRTTVRFPFGTQLRPEAAAFLDAADPLKLVTYAPSESDRWEGERADGRKIPHAVASWSRSLGAWVFAWIPGLWNRYLHRSLEAAFVAPEPEPLTKKSRSKR